MCWCRSNECLLVSGQKKNMSESIIPTDEVNLTFVWRDTILLILHCRADVAFVKPVTIQMHK